MSCLISVVSVVGMSSLLFIGGDRADPMPGKNERQGWSANIFFFQEDSLQGHDCDCSFLTLLHQVMVNYARFFLSLVISHQEAHKWRLTPTRASVTTTFFRGSARAGWAKFIWPKTRGSGARSRSSY